MEFIFVQDSDLEVKLTTNSSASSYGIPVLRVHGAGEHLGHLQLDLGPADTFPFQAHGDMLSASEWVKYMLNWTDGPHPTSDEQNEFVQSFSRLFT